MKRRQLFEFTDLSWWPQTFRSLTTDFLQSTIEVMRPFARKVSLISEALRATGATRVIDLCSGSAGPWPRLTGVLRAEFGEDLSVILTDKFPNQSASQRSDSIPSLSVFPNPVDALAVPNELTGVRTLFDGFHHFAPGPARSILADAVRTGQGIVIFEFLQRTWRDVLAVMFTPIGVLFFTPWVRPRTWSRFVFTYLIPIAPIVVSWDALVSTLRCYSTEELLSLAGGSDMAHYHWAAGTYRRLGLPVTYLVGYPKESKVT